MPWSRWRSHVILASLRLSSSTRSVRPVGYQPSAAAAEHLQRPALQETSRIVPPTGSTVAAWLYYTIAAALIGLASLLGREPRVALAAPRAVGRAHRPICGPRLRYTSHAPEHILEMLVTSALIPPLAVFWRLAGAIKYRVWFL